MTDTDELERRLRETGREFIHCHDKAAAAIREAAAAGMSPEAISHVSGLALDTVRAFLRSVSRGAS